MNEIKLSREDKEDIAKMIVSLQKKAEERMQGKLFTMHVEGPVGNLVLAGDKYKNLGDAVYSKISNSVVEIRVFPDKKTEAICVTVNVPANASGYAYTVPQFNQLVNFMEEIQEYIAKLTIKEEE